MNTRTELFEAGKHWYLLGIIKTAQRHGTYPKWKLCWNGLEWNIAIIAVWGTAAGWGMAAGWSLHMKEHCDSGAKPTAKPSCHGAGRGR